MDTFKAAVILLVEDDPGDQKLIKTSLLNEKLINEVHIANSSEEALKYLQRSKNFDNEAPMPDLILLDLNMPGMDGKELLRHIKSDDEIGTIPVVILTTSDSDKDILESYKLQAAGYIRKPMSLEELQNVMQNLSEYWFVICKRVQPGNKYKHATKRCFVSGC
jgi:CheY-like chemotaxis protein